MQASTTEAKTLRSYDPENEPHVRAIDRLVNELGISAEEVNRIYRELLEGMRGYCKVKTFLPILVSKGVKERLAQKP